MNRYSYDGPVKEFGCYVQWNWQGETMATSIEKARSNLIYQWKRTHGRTKTSKIVLPGVIKLINNGGV